MFINAAAHVPRAIHALLHGAAPRHQPAGRARYEPPVLHAQPRLKRQAQPLPLRVPHAPQAHGQARQVHALLLRPVRDAQPAANVDKLDLDAQPRMHLCDGLQQDGDGGLLHSL